ncbi:MAG: 2,3-bisphosphoglycerate-independent phosphoglycerate mutase [Chloroflexi bacterium]|nr:2,3-bisphosphoglycerate-independent phosphoglycerate mutase [Chloroflexota bacterium]
MIDFPYLDQVVQKADSKIVMLVVDGLGGAPRPDIRLSELESARIPYLDRLAGESACGLTTPVLPGIAPGSGPGHLALFGYDPLRYLVGRGVLEALGAGVEMRDGDVAARGNFCTVDGEGRIMDRRAGRIPSRESEPLCQLLDRIQVDGADLSVHHVKDYRFVLRMRGRGLSDRLTETDPQKLGATPLPVRPLEPVAAQAAQVANAFAERAAVVLKGQPRANMVLLRGWSLLPRLPSMAERYRMKLAAVAAYPMYRGLTSLAGMDVLPTGATFADEVRTLREHYEEYDFFYIHYKPADAAGEDGDFAAKVRALEQLDEHIPSLLELAANVLLVCGDHATPAIVAGHSWHPVPFLLHSRLTVGEGVERFSERACAQGSLGQIPATSVMFLALAHAGRLVKFGA